MLLGWPDFVYFYSMSKDSLHKETIIHLLNSHNKELLSYGVKEIGLFGSYVRNEATSESDIDLLVDIAMEKKTFRNFMALSYYLEDLLGKKVELVTKQSLSPYIGPHILKTVEYVSLASWILKTYIGWMQLLATWIQYK